MDLSALEIIMYGRGGQGVVTAANLLAKSAFLAGFQAMAIPFFGAERRGAPVRAYVRISSSQILRRCFIYSADLIAVFDLATLQLLQPEILARAKPDAWILVNSPNLARCLNLLSSAESYNLAVLNATEIALRNELKLEGSPIPNIPMLAAMAKLIGMDLESLKQSIIQEFGDQESILRAIQEASQSLILNPRTRDSSSARIELEIPKQSPQISIPISTPKPGAFGSTGSWRFFKPAIDASRCVGCTYCWMYCPESAIQLRAGKIPQVEYEFCKGCLICSQICPMECIAQIPELG